MDARAHRFRPRPPGSSSGVGADGRIKRVCGKTLGVDYPPTTAVIPWGIRGQRRALRPVISQAEGGTPPSLALVALIPRELDAAGSEDRTFEGFTACGS